MISERVPVAPFRERFLSMEPQPRNGERGATPKDAATRVAEELGWWHQAGWLNGSRVRQTLGLQPAPQGHGRPSKLQTTVTYEMALRLCRAMDVDPMDVGL